MRRRKGEMGGGGKRNLMAELTDRIGVETMEAVWQKNRLRWFGWSMSK